MGLRMQFHWTIFQQSWNIKTLTGCSTKGCSIPQSCNKNNQRLLDARPIRTQDCCKSTLEEQVIDFYCLTSSLILP